MTAAKPRYFMPGDPKPTHPLLLEDIAGDVYLWSISELDAETAICSIAKTLGHHFDAEEDAEAVRRGT